nr:NS4A protein [Rodent hepacivirus]
SGYVTLAGVGLSMAAVAVAIDLLGNCCLKRTWEFTTDTTAARVVQPPEDDITENLEEC